ncbi:Homoserine/homoserine lactone efflux protein [Hartmannibacter diazotrophicus]|uniref:Homoserine/homoserine lactone efflux protein n=1 Tax=Hartmannibacter diazotrophicus TaxID=1482074 RepID=A0A2C9DAG3_9HYPH|nr:LysE family translocator [Hartmannibacter diazotrophicus]SON57324.1 Homoserine/homoserine lactone efflux protein [Hartmannibacter diazotrophicus]
MTFLPDLSILVGFTLAAVFLTLTPGPDMTFYLSRTVMAGRAAGFAAFIGASAGLVVHSTLAAVGLSALLAASATAFTVLKVAGCLYLLWLALGAIRHGSAFSLDREGRKSEPLARVFLKAIGINLLNPKIIIFFVTFLPQFVSPADPHAMGKLFFLGLWFIGISIPLTIPMILGADRISTFLKSSPKFLRGFDFGFAGVMAAFAVKLVMTQGRS